MVTLRSPVFGYDSPRALVTTDMVIFTLQEHRLELLLQRAGGLHPGQWALPGGTVGIAEDLEASARRQLKEETGVAGVFLEQLYTFGAPARDPRDRIISVAYYALIPPDRLQAQAPNGADAAWFPLDALPELPLDQADIAATARERLVAKLHYSTIALQFMPSEFTLSELQQVYEAILQTRLDKRNFRKSVLATQQIEETGGERRAGAHRPARLYRVKQPGRVEIIR
ncbi:MAG TPA: NUDIX domain-containing protein [Gammaproteobacteria bacterium]|nr:NUDIX domain-containing protein [Gammaproteobacteria bacterium]